LAFATYLYFKLIVPASLVASLFLTGGFLVSSPFHHQLAYLWIWLFGNLFITARTLLYSLTFDRSRHLLIFSCAAAADSHDVLVTDSVAEPQMPLASA